MSVQEKLVASAIAFNRIGCCSGFSPLLGALERVAADAPRTSTMSQSFMAQTRRKCRSLWHLGYSGEDFV
jgi:hypothetical protein